MKISWKTASVHLLLILSFLLVPILSSPDFDYTFRLFQVTPFIKNFVGYILVIVFFYIHYYILLPKLFVPKKIVLYIFSVAGLFLFIALIEYVAFPSARQLKGVPDTHFPPGDPGPPQQFMHYAALIIPFILVLLFSHMLYLNRKAKQIELDKYRTELLNLKYQLQPHFLFNSLNNIYAISIVDTAKTPEYILKLSEILRFLLNTENLNAVLLKEDIDFCNRYIDLQALRYGQNRSEWDICFQENAEEFQIAPFLLIPIIENVFKYGIHPDKISPLFIKLEVTEGLLQLRTRNQKNNLSPQNLLISQKLGLTKTITRLELLYPSRHTLTIRETEQEYELSLTIQLRS